MLFVAMEALSGYQQQNSSCTCLSVRCGPLYMCLLQHSGLPVAAKKHATSTVRLGWVRFLIKIHFGGRMVAAVKE